MLGPLEVRRTDGAVADVPGARLRALLVTLALRPGHQVSKAALVDRIWGDEPPADATNALQRLVSRLRKALPDAVVEGLTDGYRLNVSPDAVDAVRFERLVGAGQAAAGDAARRAELLREALGLWRGAAMQDVGLPESEALDAAAARLEGMRLTAAEACFEAELTLGRGADLVTELTDWVAAHPLRERLVAALMRALAAAGRESDALQLYQSTREALADELGADPSADLSSLHVAILRGEAGRREESRETNLRAELTSFVGRDADVAAVRELIAGHRLTTVIGPGGAGKTRLAVESARVLLDSFPDGAWLVELAALGADGDVAQAALGALRLRDALLGTSSNAEPMDRLIAALREREALLILDNCEHLIGPAAEFAHHLLGECRRLRILATSREPLGITGEALWPATPLETPAQDAALHEIEAAPAVKLLCDRARAVRQDLNIDGAMLATMAHICRALDGMPLAVELAAARLRTMSVDQLAARLDDRFRLLTGGSRTALPRHKTLRAVVDWSWELLGDAERSVLRRLSVFAGSAGLEGAEQVCSGDGVEPYEVLDLLTALAEKSLLVTEGEDAPRYRMSGTIRQYAEQRLAEAGEADQARRAHLDYLTRLAETAEPQLRGADQLTWLAALEAEHDDIGSALRGALAAGDAQAAMRLAAASAWYWWLAGHRAEGMRLITAADEAPGEVSDGIRATVCALLVMFVTSGRGDEHRAAEWIHKAYAYSLRAPKAHPLLGFVVPLERMLTAPEEFLPAFEALLDDEDTWARALARLQLGKMRITLGQEGYEADAHLEAALAEFRAIGERYGISFALSELAERAAVRGDFAAACDHLEQSAVVLAEVGAVEDVIRVRSRQAVFYRRLGDAEAGAASLAEAQRCAERVAWPDALAELALARAELARADEDPQEAKRQVGLALSLLGEGAQEATMRALTHDLLGYLAEDLEESRGHRAAAVEAAAEAGHAPLIAGVLVGAADLALRRGDPAQAARLLASGDAVRGLPDLATPDAARIASEALSRLGEPGFADAAREGAGTTWSELVAVTLAP